MLLLVWSELYWQQSECIVSNKDRLTCCRGSRWWYDLSYAKEVTNRNDIVSMIWGLIQQSEHIISNKDRLTSCKSSRWWYDLSYAKGTTNRNDIVSMMWD